VFICICNAIREADFRRAAREHPGDAEAVYECMGHETQCGQCIHPATQILEKERGAQEVREQVPA